MSDIQQLFDAADDLLKNHLDNLMLRYRDTEPSLYERYERARTIVDL